MTRSAFFSLLFITILYNSCQTNSTSSENIDSSLDTLHIRLDQITYGLENPIYLTNAGDSSNRLFTVLQSGEILIIKNDEIKSDPFLNISDRVEDMAPAFSEMGLIGLAFHPDYAANGSFYVYYTHKINADKKGYVSHLSEFKVSRENPDIADPESERIIMEIDFDGFFANGGNIEFGPDGMLYLGIGEGSGDNSKGYAQDIQNIFGSILRIDVNGEHPYQIPDDNPFVESSNPEIWAYGLRNPYRFSFDPITGSLICGDVGDLLKEEINFIEKGKNYGWPVYEGTILSENQDPDSLNFASVLPFTEYNHDIGFGSAVVGTFRYRGNTYPEMKKKLIVADWSGDIYYQDDLNSDLRKTVIDNLDEIASKDREIFRDGDFEMVMPKYYINSLGVDESGEIYLVGQRGMGPANGSGSVFRIHFIETDL